MYIGNLNSIIIVLFISCKKFFFYNFLKSLVVIQIQRRKTSQKRLVVDARTRKWKWDFVDAIRTRTWVRMEWANWRRREVDYEDTLHMKTSAPIGAWNFNFPPNYIDLFRGGRRLCWPVAWAAPPPSSKAGHPAQETGSSCQQKQLSSPS